MNDGINSEVDRNYEAFVAMLDTLLPLHRNEWALLRDGSTVAFYPDEEKALRAGRANFDDGRYSIQQVTDRPADLGFFSHAINPRLA